MIPKYGTEPGIPPRPAGVAARDRRGGGGGSVDEVRQGGRVELTAGEFGERFAASWRVLWCAAVSVVRDRTLAQDIVQQSAIVGLERLADFDTGTSFVSWMARIVKNIALNEARKRARRRTHPAESATLDAYAGTEQVRASGGLVLNGRGGVMPDQEAFDDEVLGALDHLDDTARGCLLLRVVLNMPYHEIALALDIPEGTAASHVHRARRAMRDGLSERFVTRRQGDRT